MTALHQLRTALVAAALLLVGGAASAAPLGPASEATADLSYDSFFGELFILDEPFTSGPLAGETFDVIIDPTGSNSDEFFLAGELALQSTLISDDGDELVYRLSGFNGAPTAFPLGVEFAISGFRFQSDAIGSIAALSNDQTFQDISFSASAVVPLPAAAWLLMSGVAALAGVRFSRIVNPGRP